MEDKILDGEIFFTIPVTPTGQARPRVTIRGKFAHAYKTKEQEANERTLEAYLKEYVPEKPLEGAVKLIIWAFLPVPKSISKKRILAMLNYEELPIKRPDIDNIQKQILDAMTRLQFWKDDSQITEIACHKYYSETGHIVIGLWNKPYKGNASC